jgi:hypothetical protein
LLAIAPMSVFVLTQSVFDLSTRVLNFRRLLATVSLSDDFNRNIGVFVLSKIPRRCILRTLELKATFGAYRHVHLRPVADSLREIGIVIVALLQHVGLQSKSRDLPQRT